MVEKYVREETMIRGPKFVTRLRSHTVYENTAIKLICTVQGYPVPVVKWYKDGVILDTSAGRCIVEDNAGMRSLEIPRCCTDDTALYTVVASNIHGQASSQASVIVKRYRQEDESCVYAWLPYTAPMLSKIQYTKINITFLEKFGPVFATEGGSASLTATMDLNPNLANLQPDTQWYRDDTRLFDSKWVKIITGRGVSTLTIPNLYKDDEGLYTLRLVTKGGTAEHSAFISVSDGPPPVVGAPGAPMDIKIHDANRDYVIVSWKPPNTTTEGPILGYFVDKCEVGTENWTQCNDHPIKICKYPVPGLFEGHSYYFRARAVNARGISKPCRMSSPIAALDPTEFERLHALKLEGKLDVVSCDDDLEAEGKPPGSPSGIYASETDRTYVVLSWKAPAYSSKAPMWYYIEKCLAGANAWQRVNTQVPVRSPRYAVFDLAEGKEYLFRVLSANMYGISEPSEASELIQTQALKGVPSAPGQVIATRETDTSLLIQWAPPKEPNNLIGYYIDQCVKGSKDWTSANHKPHRNTKFIVSGLTTDETYVFRVQAINELGLSDESQESSPLSVKAALTSPSACYDIALLGCDGQSMVLNWKKSLHSGGASVTDYYVDKRRSGTSMWREVHIPPVTERVYQVEGLEESSSYVFRMRAVNEAGVGVASMASDSVVAKALPGSQEVSCSVDEKSGNIVFSFESCQMNAGSEFLWKKNYKEITDFSSGIVVHTEGNLCKLMFTNPDKEDIGTYSVSVSNTDGVSSSCSVSAEELQKMLALSYDIRHPIIPLKSELAYKILERGRMRFWLQAEEISSKVTYKFFANNKELSGADPNKMAHNATTGVIEFIMDHFTGDNEGTYTCQITDGGGKGQSSLVLIGDGPHFSEFLSVQVGEDCSVTLVCKFSRQTAGVYKATISDDRGKDMSQIDISGKGASAAELVINCTATGIQLQCHMKYYTSEMNIHWQHGESKVVHSEKNVIGGTSAMATIETLSLTCTVCGDPKPQVSWLKNGNEVEPDNQYVVTLDQGKFACLTINGVGMDDSGRYSMIVQNKYGGESVDIVVSVYRHGEKIPEAKPTLTPKTIIPPKLPIELPQPKNTAVPSSAPSSPSPAPPKAAGGRGMKSPTPTRKK
ncbi:hypothetical protein CRUP_025676 [Coryphaenoides rupestris]|nr:hypothetical protein CRUP_025676 [Coryphaenoides rupestris]